MMKKKTVFIILLNLAAAALVIFAFDYALFVKDSFRFSYVKEHNLPFFEKGRKFKEICDRKYFAYLHPFIESIYRLKFRDRITDKSKDAVLIWGCSFANGLGLSYDESFGVMLSKYADKTVFNRAIDGCGAKEALMQSELLYILKNYYEQKEKNPDLTFEECMNGLDFDEITKESFKKLFKDKKFQKIITKWYKPILDSGKVKYIIYVFIEAHIKRMYSQLLEPSETDLRLADYKYKNGRFIFNNPYKGRFRILYLRDKFKSRERKLKDKDNQLKLFEQYLKEIKRLNALTFGREIKFIIINYNDEYNNYYYNNLHRFSGGFECIQMTNLLKGRIEEAEYKLSDGWHPSAKVWEEAVPKLTEKLVFYKVFQ